MKNNVLTEACFFSHDFKMQRKNIYQEMTYKNKDCYKHSNDNYISIKMN